jgi:hypothetical protein
MKVCRNIFYSINHKDAEAEEYTGKDGKVIYQVGRGLIFYTLS